MKYTDFFDRYIISPGIIVLAGISILFIYACSTDMGKVDLQHEARESFSFSGSDTMSATWWYSFNDASLNALVDSAIRRNYDLKIAWQRMKSAAAVLQREKAPLFPFLDAYASGNINSSKNEFRDGRSFEAGLSAEYEIDLWGRIRAQVEAEEFRLEASKQNYKAAAISISSSVALSWFQLTEAKQELDLIEKQIATSEKMLELIKARFGSGQIRSVDILRQKQQIESTKEQRILVKNRIERLQNFLSTLIGIPAVNDFAFETDSLPELPGLPTTGVPLESVQRRPDVQIAYNLLKAADKDLAAAISKRYPRLSLNASVSSLSDASSELFKDWAYSVGGNLLAPIFYGRQLQAAADRAKAIKNERLYEYVQTVLNAFREVEDALANEINQKDLISSIEKQLDLAQKSYKQLQIEYLNGMSDYLDVLIALNEEQQLRRDLLSARLSLLEYRIFLYRSLAGGFDTFREREED